jgi:predicted adenylyl cyclase CyaB
MPRNIEIKARVDDIEALKMAAAAIADQGPAELEQDDTFFRCDAGRLKLRVFADGMGELIFYRRANKQGPKESSYWLSPTTSPDSLRQALTLAYGELGRVKKHRTLYLAGRTRIHLDRVDRLGNYLELEVVLRTDEPADSGVREATALMRRLNIGREQLIESAYIDLLLQIPSRRPFLKVPKMLDDVCHSAMSGTQLSSTFQRSRPY